MGANKSDWKSCPQLSANSPTNLSWYFHEDQVDEFSGSATHLASIICRRQRERDWKHSTAFQGCFSSIPRLDFICIFTWNEVKHDQLDDSTYPKVTVDAGGYRGSGQCLQFSFE